MINRPDRRDILMILCLGACALFWHFSAYQEDWKGGYRTTPVSVVRQGDFKLFEFFEDRRLEIYNLKDDPGETTNLTSSMPDHAVALPERLRKWQRSINAPTDLPKNPRYDPDFKLDPEKVLEIINERNRK